MSYTLSGLNGLNFNQESLNTPMEKIKISGSLVSDYIIPEQTPDIKTILNENCDIKINEIQAGNNSLTVSGTAYRKILFLSEDGKLGTVINEENFEFKDFVEGINEDSLLIDIQTQEICSSRLINPRKVQITSEIILELMAMNETDITPIIRGAETIEDEKSIRKLRNCVSYLDVCSITEGDIPVSHDLSLDGNLPPMSEIIYSNIKIIPVAIVTANNSIIIKSKAVYAAIYKSEEGNIFSLEKQIYLERQVDIENASAYTWTASASADELSSEIAIDSYGEAKLIEIDFSYDLSIKGIKNNKVDLIADAYSTDYTCQLSEVVTDGVVYKRSYGTSLSVNASASRDEISAENARILVIGNVDVDNIKYTYYNDKKHLVVEADAIVRAVTENNIITDEDQKFGNVTFLYPFKCELDIGEQSEDSFYDISIKVSDVRFRFDQTKIFCDFEADITVHALEKTSYRCVKEIVIDKNNPIDAACAPITLCYPSGKETLWDIAKYYNSTVEEIMSANGLEDDSIDGKKVILIPYKQKSWALSDKGK